MGCASTTISLYSDWNVVVSKEDSQRKVSTTMTVIVYFDTSNRYKAVEKYQVQDVEKMCNNFQNSSIRNL